MDYKKIDKQYCSTPLSDDPSYLYRVCANGLKNGMEKTLRRKLGTTKPAPAMSSDDSNHNQATDAAKVEASEDSEPRS